MNLTMDVLRMLTVKALHGRTWCGRRVYDSPAEPADLRLPKERAPYIGVYIDDGDNDLDTSPGVGAASFYSGDPTCWLLVEISVAGQAEDAPDRDPDKVQDPAMQRVKADGAALAYSDAGLELRIGLMARQVLDALADPGNPWAELWRTLAPERKKLQVRRGGSGLEQPEEPAIRYASRILRIHVGTLSEPAPGAAEGPGFWRDCLAALAADGQMEGIAPVLRQFLAPEPEAEWRALQREGMWTEAAVRGIGLGPALRTLDGQPWEETPHKEDNSGVEPIQE